MANTRTRNQQSPNLEDDDSVEGDLADLTPSAFKHPFVAPPPGAFKTMPGSRKWRKRDAEVREKEREEKEEREREKEEREREKREEREREKKEREREKREREEKASQITKNQILSEQRELKNWEERCSITKEAVIKTARTIIFSVMIAYLFAILWLAVVGSLGWFVIKKSVS